MKQQMQTPASNHEVAAMRAMLDTAIAAAQAAQRYGHTPFVLSDAVQDQARDVGQMLAALALQSTRRQQPFAPPCVLISRGGTSVTVRGSGRGARNVECQLSFARACVGHPKIHALMGDTDGIDGAVTNAGAWSHGINPSQALDANEAHSFSDALDARVVTGPTRTNVNDFRVVLIAA